MTVLNRLDRYHLAIDVIDRVPGLAVGAAHVKQRFRDKLLEHTRYVREHGEDMPEIRSWVWPGKTSAEAGD
jgi:xylulose-5-phosphate/fructose-6-phosphate phosphoketolase